MKFTSTTNKDDINVAKALTTLDKELVDLGLGYDEIVESRSHLIGESLGNMIHTIPLKRISNMKM